MKGLRKIRVLNGQVVDASIARTQHLPVLYRETNSVIVFSVYKYLQQIILSFLEENYSPILIDSSHHKQQPHL